MKLIDTTPSQTLPTEKRNINYRGSIFSRIFTPKLLLGTVVRSLQAVSGIFQPRQEITNNYALGTKSAIFQLRGWNLTIFLFSTTCLEKPDRIYICK
jgi:hypothetical protein